MKYVVNVGNIGNIECENGFEARKIYGKYKKLSIDNVGRAAGENVVLFCDDEIVHEYFGTMSEYGIDTQ